MIRNFIMISSDWYVYILYIYEWYSNKLAIYIISEIEKLSFSSGYTRNCHFDNFFTASDENFIKFPISFFI